MNIVKNLIARVEEYRKDNKKPCKSYATEERAEQEAVKVAKVVAEHFQGPGAEPVHYIVAYNEAWDRWVIFFHMTELLSRRNSGGYVGACGDHFTF